MDKQILLHKDMEDELSRLEQTKAEMEQLLRELPEGTIHQRKDRHYHVFRVKGKQRMLSTERYRGVQCKELWLLGDVDPEEWGRAEYEQNPMPIKKPSQTAGGRVVRSKSEAIIGSEIEGVSLMHRYEQKLVICGEVFYPDFMFVLPLSRRLVIWEHFGRMDDPEYVVKAMHKLEAYSRAGWILGRDLFVTYETEMLPFSFTEAKTKLAEILAQDRDCW